jgi:hypothetical protein
MSVIRPFDKFLVLISSGDSSSITATIIFSDSNSPVGQARFWMSGTSLPLASDSGSQTTLHYRIEQLQDILACLKLPGRHRLNYTDPANASIDFDT